jgi:opacity protein-like surface antigen
MKMKLVTIALSGVMLTSGAALGSDFDPRFYVGAELQGNQFKNPVKEIKDVNGGISTRYDNKPFISKKTASGSLFVGSNLNENFGVELGYVRMGKHRKTWKDTYTRGGVPTSSITQKLVTKHHNMYADLLGYLPVSDCVDLIGSLGVGRLNSKIVATEANNLQNLKATLANVKSTKAGIRLGAGAQFKFNENIGARLMLRHQKGNKLVKSVNSAGLGLFYQF